MPVVIAVNRQFDACSPADRYASLFYAVFDKHARTLHYVNAGQNPAFVVRGGRDGTWLEASALPPTNFQGDNQTADATILAALVH